MHGLDWIDPQSPDESLRELPNCLGAVKRPARSMCFKSRRGYPNTTSG